MKLFNILKYVFTDIFMVFSGAALGCSITETANAFGHTDILFYVFGVCLFVFVFSIVVGLIWI